jgi:phosphoserine phosphatase RsbU/P
MLTVDKFSVLLHQLQQLDRPSYDDSDVDRARGESILHSFLRFAEFDQGAIWLSRDGELRLAASAGPWVLPESLSVDIPSDVFHRSSDSAKLDATLIGRSLSPPPDVILPIRRGEEIYGLVALERSTEERFSDSEIHLLRAAGQYLSELLANRRLAVEAREGRFLSRIHELELESLYEIGMSIASTLNLDELTEEILMRAVSLLNARRAALYLRERGSFVLYRSFGETGPKLLERELSASAANELLEEGHFLVRTDDAGVIFPGCASAVALPIRSERGVIGVLAVADREFRDGVGPFEQSDIRTLSLFASQAAIALENTRLHRQALEKQAMERELELAATIQREILPRAIVPPDGFDLDVWTRPARQLGGDYHAFMATESAASLCVADVAGKSTPAAILVSACHAALQLLFDEGRELGDIAKELNRHIHRWSSHNKFITMVLATIDREKQVLLYVNAGHNPAYLVHDGTVQPLRSHGLPIGMMAGTEYETMSAAFPPGSLLVIYSDGITEAVDGADEEYGDDRLVEVIAEHAMLPCLRLREKIIESVDSFVAGHPQTDDQTIALVRTL